VQMAKFNAYSFCRAHAASYAVLAYAGAYLKAHYPLEFWVAALNNNQSMYPTRAYVEQAKRQGVRFLLPDVNRSEAEFTIEDDAVRVGLGRVGGLGPAHVEAILDARSDRPFDGLSDCLARARLGRNEARSLILCGAFDWTGRPTPAVARMGEGRSRPTLMMEMNLFFALGSWRHSDDVLLLSAGPNIPNVPIDYSDGRKYFDERHILGLSVREHIVARCRAAICGAGILPARGMGVPPVRGMGVPPMSRTGVSPVASSVSSVSSSSFSSSSRPTTETAHGRDARATHGQDARATHSPYGCATNIDSLQLPSMVGRRVRLAGVVEAQRTTTTRNGQNMMFLTMEDEHGMFEATLLGDAYGAFGSLTNYGPYIVTGGVQDQYGAITVAVESMELVAIREERF